MRSEEERLKAGVRKWGHSLGVILPKPITRKLNLREHETVELKIKRRETGLMDLFGTLKFPEPTKKMMKTIKEGWKE